MKKRILIDIVLDCIPTKPIDIEWAFVKVIPFYQPRLSLIPAWINIHIPSKNRHVTSSPYNVMGVIIYNYLSIMRLK